MTDENSKGYTISWLGYNPKPNVNRIWGYLTMDDERIYVFWGVRGKRQQFKPHNEWVLARLVHLQEQKGYNKVDPVDYEKMQPGFTDELEVWLTTNILADTFR